MSFPRILLVTPFDRDRAALLSLLTAEGYVVDTVRTPEEGQVMAATRPPAVVVADAQVPGLDGDRIVRTFRALPGEPRIVLLCPRARHAPPIPGVLCMVKPIDVDRLLAFIASATRARVRVA